jgi:hypothetical protein
MTPYRIEGPKVPGFMLGYLIEMDGVLRRCGRVTDEAVPFLNGLRAARIPFLVLAPDRPETRRTLTTSLRDAGYALTYHHLFPGGGGDSALRAARRELALPADQTVVVAGSLETMFIAGVLLRHRTILSRRDIPAEDLELLVHRPDLAVRSAADLDAHAIEDQMGSSPHLRGREDRATRTRRLSLAAP